MQIIKNAQGKLETTGSADDEAQSEAAIRAKIAKDRASLRRMLEGNGQFFDDPMRKPVEQPRVQSRLKRILDGDLTDQEWKDLLYLRGGCGCRHPNASPPCYNCTKEISLDEAEYLADE